VRRKEPRSFKEVDPALRYAPPRVRDQGRKSPESSPLPSRRRVSFGVDVGDHGITETQRRPTLEPEWLPQPPQSSIRGHRWWRVTLWTAGVLGFAALIAWALVLIPAVRRLANELTQATSGASISADLKEANSLAVALKRRTERLRSEVTVSEEAVRQTWARPDPPEPASSALVVVSPPAAVTAPELSPKPPDFVTRQLPREELVSMLQRADDFIKSGDLSSARLLLRRAAEAGDVHAALTLAGTFDPNVLKALGFQDAVADVAMARLWYERAEKFGSAEAPRRLQQLSTINVAP
jgi:hypothetical protein